MIKQPHILCSPQDISKIVLLPGDPERAKLIAQKYLKKSILVASNREFVTYTGYYSAIKITVTSTGIGSPSTAIATEELINLGVKILIRVGTCGGALKKEIKVGSVIIPTASIREEGTTKEYMPPEFPAVANYKVIQALEQSAKNQKFPYYVGINRTHDAFYGKSSNFKRWGQLYLNPRMKKWDYPLLSSEMECAPLFLISTMRNVLSGAVLAVNYNPEPLDQIVKNQFRFSIPGTHLNTKKARISVDRAIRTALGAIEILKPLL